MEKTPWKLVLTAVLYLLGWNKIKYQDHLILDHFHHPTTKLKWGYILNYSFGFNFLGHRYSSLDPYRCISGYWKNMIILVFSYDQKWNIEYIIFFIHICVFLFGKNTNMYDECSTFYIFFCLTFVFCLSNNSKHSEILLSWYCHQRSSLKLSFVLIRATSLQLKFIMPETRVLGSSNRSSRNAIVNL